MDVALQAGEKRDVLDSPDAAGGVFKRVRVEEIAPIPPPMPEEDVVAPVDLPPLQPYPFFRYADYSTEKDPDSLQPLTPPGRVPNFPAKMHSILSRPELHDIVSWLPHGRSWRILKPREFEIKVIPTYFEHSKFSSFIRQANGWGFRRITNGQDRNSYYHERFLRNLPHLCKSMKRPGVSKKLPAEPEHEPNLHAISEQFPVPEHRPDDSILLQCTINGGPKARMPIYSGAVSSAASAESPNMRNLAPVDQTSVLGFASSLGTSHNFTIPPAARAPVVQAPVPATAPSPLAMASTLNPQFAAGFAAATLSHQQQFQSILQSFMEVATNVIKEQQQQKDNNQS